MPKFFRSISGREMVKLLKKLGFFEVSQKGSHIKIRKELTAHVETVIIPDHKELTPGTFRNILKMADLSLEDFDKLSNK
ncbi:MAG: type II toxin-antitoxin system HicA family toxin [Patescibacteria group bacterium]